MIQQMGKMMLMVGILIAVVGLILWLAGNKFNWLGNLPGDISIKKEHFKFYMPITTMLLFSAVVSGLIWIIRKFL